MSKYKIEFVKSARKEFDRLESRLQAKVVDALRLLAENPYSELLRIKKLKGADNLFRIRLGDHRVLFEIRDEQLIVLVIKIGNRRDVYR